jgi:hypothetical protein
LFIPDGHIPIRRAVRTIATKIDPAVEDVPSATVVIDAMRAAADARSRRLGAETIESLSAKSESLIAAQRAGLEKWDRASRKARSRIRQALGHGVLTAVALLPDGTIQELQPHPWRTEAGATALTTGTLAVVVDPLVPPAACDVFLSEVAFRKWDHSVPGVRVPQPDASTNAPASDGSPSVSARRRSAGGRPQRDDWWLFDREVNRIVGIDGGYLTRTELRRRMKLWAAQHMAEPPDDRTIDRRTDRSVSDEVLAP